MKKTHGDFTPIKSHLFDNPRAIFRHQSLMQDFGELYEETQAMRRRLNTLKERKAMLVAEVRFLRRRYKHLTQDQPVRKLPFQPTDSKTRGRSHGGKIKKRKEASPSLLPVHGIGATKNPVALPDLNQSERVHDENGTNLKRRVPVFDLNQISGEEEEVEVDKEQRMPVVDLKAGSDKRTRNSEPLGQKEMNLSVCGKSGNRSNKRKISWQDPVAVRV